MKFCADCKHYVGMLQGPDDAWYERCNRARPPLHDLVTGKQVWRDELKPSVERYKGECGQNALFFLSRTADSASTGESESYG